MKAPAAPKLQHASMRSPCDLLEDDSPDAHDITELSGPKNESQYEKASLRRDIRLQRLHLFS
jgi:hypothetical protein